MSTKQTFHDKKSYDKDFVYLNVITNFGLKILSRARHEKVYYSRMHQKQLKYWWEIQCSSSEQNQCNPSTNKQKKEDFVKIINLYRWSVTLFIVCSVLVQTSQFFGDPVQCETVSFFQFLLAINQFVALEVRYLGDYFNWNHQKFVIYEILFLFLRNFV